MKTLNAEGLIFIGSACPTMGMLCRSTTHNRKLVHEKTFMKKNGELLDHSGFTAFWVDYPRKAGKKDAEKAWRKLRPDDDMRQQIHAALVWQKQQRGWLDSEEFIPLPATYLRGERWTDERPGAAKRSTLSVADEARRWASLPPGEQARRLGLK